MRAFNDPFIRDSHVDVTPLPFQHKEANKAKGSHKTECRKKVNKLELINSVNRDHLNQQETSRVIFPVCFKSNVLQKWHHLNKNVRLTAGHLILQLSDSQLKDLRVDIVLHIVPLDLMRWIDSVMSYLFFWAKQEGKHVRQIN